MLEEILGDSLAYVVRLLPLEITIIVVVMLVLHRTGTLERMSKSINHFIISLFDADKARKQFKQELETLELAHDDKLETLQVEARLQSQATYDLEHQRARQELLELTVKHIAFLEKEVIKQNDFLRTLVIEYRSRLHETATGINQDT